MRKPSHHGESLVELLVALVLLEIVGAAALATALTIERAGRQVVAASAEDLSRWQLYRAAELQPACTGATRADTVPLSWPATTHRPAFRAVTRCGP